jgi:hypothetical protein
VPARGNHTADGVNGESHHAAGEGRLDIGTFEHVGCCAHPFIQICNKCLHFTKFRGNLVTAGGAEVKNLEALFGDVLIRSCDVGYVACKVAVDLCAAPLQLQQSLGSGQFFGYQRL